MRTLSLLFIGVLLFAAPADEEQKELDRLQGEWKVERVESGGRSVVPPAEASTLIVERDKFIPGHNREDVARVKLRPDKMPAWIDLTDRGGQTMTGIYRLDGDQWDICLARPGKPRPTDFQTDGGVTSRVMVLKRRQKE